MEQTCIGLTSGRSLQDISQTEMKGFRKLLILGVLMVTLLLIIDTIDAGKKQGKKKELETDKSFDQENSKFTSKSRHTESIKLEKSKKSGTQSSENYGDEYQYESKDSKFGWKKPEVKKNMKFASKDKKYTENGKTKTTKPFQKFKKSKFLEEEPEEKLDSSKMKVKKTKPQYMRSENVDRVVKTVKKTTQKKLFDENENVEKIINEELDKIKNEETMSAEESVSGSSKKKKYKLVEVVLEEDGQEDEQEGNETTSEPGSEDREFVNFEREEITEKTRWIHNPKTYKNKKSSKKYNPIEEEQNDEPLNEDNNFNNTEENDDAELPEELEVDSFASKYSDPLEESCHRLPEDPNRIGPKKLTLYVIEEEINGQIKKRVVSEEDGVTMCEVADLLKELYNTDIPEE